MQEQEIGQILVNQDILSLSKLIESKKDLSNIKLVQYLAEILNQKKEINIEFLKLLLQTNIDKESATKKGLLPSHLATLFGDAKVTRVFIDNGFNMNEKIELPRYHTYNDGATNYDKTTTISISSFSSAFFKYDSVNIKLLIENGADVNENIHRVFRDIYTRYTFALSEATKKNDTDIVKLLIDKGAKGLDIILLIEACRHNNIELVKLFLDKGVVVNMPEDENFFITTPLISICANKIIEIDIDNESQNLNTTLDIVKVLLENGADVNMGSPLMATCSQDDGISFEGDEILFSEQHRYRQSVTIDTEVLNLLLEYGANVNYIDYNGKSILMEVCSKKNKYEVAKILIENGVNINHQDKNGNTALMLLTDTDLEKLEFDFDEDRNYQQEEKEIFPSEEMIQLLIDNGADINIKNNMGMTPLMKYSIENNHRLVKILLERGADINIKSEMTAFDLSTDDDIKSLIKKSKNNNPQKLVKILTNFTEDKPMKFTTHNWDFGDLDKSTYKNFDGYMNAVKLQWDSIKNDLETLSPNLYKKVNNFLWETDPAKAIGWSSTDGLAQWCDDGNKPLDFKNFKEIVSSFKKEIEIRKENNILENIFIQERKKLGRKFKVELIKLKGQTFYTDTEKFTNAINTIFTQMSEESRHKYPNITIECIGDSTQEFIELKITQIDSVSQSSAEVMLEEVNNGDFASIKENLTNLCDWSIESGFEDTNYRVNYLKNNNIKDIEELNYKPLGFTHILRFYNK